MCQAQKRQISRGLRGSKHALSFRDAEGVATDAWNTHNLQAERRDKGGGGKWVLGLWDPGAKQLEREKSSKIKRAQVLLDARRIDQLTEKSCKNLETLAQIPSSFQFSLFFPAKKES